MIATGWLIFTSITMALGKEANINIDNDLLQGIWMASILFAALLSVGGMALLDSTIDDGS